MKEGLIAVFWLVVGGLSPLGLELWGEEHPAVWAKWAFWICALLLIAIYAVRIVNMIRNRKEDAPDVVADRAEAMRRQEEILSDSAPEKAEIERLGHRVWLIWAVLVGLNLLLRLFAGMGFGDAGSMGIIVAAVSMWSLGPLLAFALRPPRFATPEKGTELLEKDFPNLFAMVREAAKEAGHCRRIRIFLGDQGIGVFRERKYDGILLPPLLTRFLTKAELRQVMRHEFAHLVSEEVALEARWLSLIDRMDKTINSGTGMFFVGLFPMIRATAEFSERVTRYRAFIERKMEAEADEHALSPEEARDAVAAIAKSGMFARFGEEDRVSAYRCFESETPRDDQVNIRGAVFEKMLAERGRIWLDELESRQAAQFDSHPTFRQRREAYGVVNYDAFSKESDAVWLAEMDRLCDKENTFLAGNPEYKQMRMHQYVFRSEAMQTYEKSDAPLEKLETQQLIDAAEAYFGLDTPKAMKIMRDLLEKEPNNYEAKLLLGLWMLDSRDDKGLEYLYQAAENGNYAARALTEVGDYVYRRGRSDQIEEYMRRSAELLQQAVDFHYHLDAVHMKDLKPRTISDELLDELVNEMVRLGDGNIAAIGCAAKDFGSEDAAHVFILQYAGDDETKNEQTNMRVFELLDQREENYALREDGELPLKRLEKLVPDCIVYQKNKDR